MYSLVVLVFKTEKEAFKALKSKLLIVEISIRTAEYTVNKFSDQCKAYQRFKHLQTQCKYQAKCAFCAETHNIRQHKCKIYIVVAESVCLHTIYKCCNCNEVHKADSTECKHY